MSFHNDEVRPVFAEQTMVPFQLGEKEEGRTRRQSVHCGEEVLYCTRSQVRGGGRGDFTQVRGTRLRYKSAMEQLGRETGGLMQARSFQYGGK